MSPSFFLKPRAFGGVFLNPSHLRLERRFGYRDRDEATDAFGE